MSDPRCLLSSVRDAQEKAGYISNKEKVKQAGAELCQAQLS